MGGLLLNTGGAVNGLIVQNGNVGIGTSNPTQRLDVAGYVKSTGLCLGTDCRAAWPGGGGTTTPTGPTIYEEPIGCGGDLTFSRSCFTGYQRASYVAPASCGFRCTTSPSVSNTYYACNGTSGGSSPATCPTLARGILPGASAASPPRGYAEGATASCSMVVSGVTQYGYVKYEGGVGYARATGGGGDTGWTQTTAQACYLGRCHEAITRATLLTRTGLLGAEYGVDAYSWYDGGRGSGTCTVWLP